METRKETAMAQKHMAIGMKKRKDRLTRPFLLVEIEGIEPSTFSMPLAYREQVK